MKRNMLATMERLEIDKGIRGLIRQLWKHCYRTKFSCEGHSSAFGAYVMFTGGDRWFEDKAAQYGLRKHRNSICCEIYPLDNCCSKCGAGVNGNTIYRGRFIQNPLRPNL